jgi:DNA modification methylase
VSAKRAQPDQADFLLVDVDQLEPDPRNSRTHSPEQLAQVEASIERFGFANTVGFRREGERLVLVYGHARTESAKAKWSRGEDVLGPGKRRPLPRGKLPAIDLTGLSEEEIRAYIIADNQLALNAGWDEAILRNELLALDGLGFDLDVIGFNPDELADLLAQGTEGLTDPDDAPPLPEHPVSVPGDMWLLGKHRLICGSSTDADVVGRVLGEDKPNLMATDPPYGVEYDPAWRNETGKDAAGVTRHKSSGKVVSAVATRATGKVQNDDQADWREAWALFPGNVAYVWHGGLHSVEVAASLEAVRMPPRAQIVWVKTRMAIGRGNYHWQHEPALYAVREGADDGWTSHDPDGRFADEHETAIYAVRKGKPGRWRGGRKQTTVWFIEHLKNDTGHGTQKPVECMRRPILNNSAPGEAVYEPFSGSGTTIIAGEMTDRRVLAVELDPAYVDVAVRRWQDFTGQSATLAARGDGVDAFAGRTFNEVAEGRLPMEQAA